MTNTTVDRSEIYSEAEVDGMMEAAERISCEEFRLRAQALIDLLRTGKRRREVAQLEVTNLELAGESLLVTFHVSKKRKKEAAEYLTRRQKSLPAEEKFTKAILDYWNFIKNKYPGSKYLFPSSVNHFSQRVVLMDKHLSGRQILAIIKATNPRGWCHLFRETQGGMIAQKEGDSITALFKIARRLDSEKKSV